MIYRIEEASFAPAILATSTTKNRWHVRMSTSARIHHRIIALKYASIPKEVIGASVRLALNRAVSTDRIAILEVSTSIFTLLR